MRRLAGISLLLSAVPFVVADIAWAQAPAAGQLVLRPTSIPADATLPPPVPLPPLVADDTVAGRAVRVQPEPAVVTTTDDIETGAIPLRRPVLTDPYEPLGIRAGGFVAYPSLTVTFGGTTNAAAAAGGSASTYAVLSPELLLRSDWNVHEATFGLRGSFQRYFDNLTDDRPELTAAATARLDLSDGWHTPLAASYTFRTQSPSSTDFPAGVDSPPGVHELKGSVGATREGLLKLQGELSADRSQYDNGASGGVPVDQGDRTNTVYGARLRAGYAVTPALAPFVEAELDWRQFDRTVDAGGLRRSGALQYLRGGIAFDRGPILTGEVKFGYGVATFDDATLATVRAFTADGNLVWSPTVLTRVTLNGATAINPSTNAASSGSVVYEGSIDVAYAWRTNITVNGTAGVRHERVQGTGEVDTGATAGLAATWRANRSLWVTAGYEHQWLDSNVAGKAFQSDAVRVELKTQR